MSENMRMRLREMELAISALHKKKLPYTSPVEGYTPTEAEALNHVMRRAEEHLVLYDDANKYRRDMHGCLLEVGDHVRYDSTVYSGGDKKYKKASYESVVEKFREDNYVQLVNRTCILSSDLERIEIAKKAETKHIFYDMDNFPLHEGDWVFLLEKHEQAGELMRCKGVRRITELHRFWQGEWEDHCSFVGYDLTFRVNTKNTRKLSNHTTIDSNGTTLHEGDRVVNAGGKRVDQRFESDIYIVYAIYSKLTPEGYAGLCIKNDGKIRNFLPGDVLLERKFDREA